jgi:hypothetical protein
VNPAIRRRRSLCSEAAHNRFEMTPRVDLTAYRPLFLDLFIEWRIQPLSVRPNPLKAMSGAKVPESRRPL